MKSLSILIVLVAASQAVWVKDSGTRPEQPETISQGGELTLFCKTNSQPWNHCEFTHENDGRSCKIEFKDSRGTRDPNWDKDCSERMTVGNVDFQTCEIVIKQVDLSKDAGDWKCTLTKEQNIHSQTIQVKFNQGPGSNPDQKPSHQVENTKETPTLMGVRSAILAFTFLITAVFVAGCLVLLPKNWPLLRDQCCSWK